MFDISAMGRQRCVLAAGCLEPLSWTDVPAARRTVDTIAGVAA